MTTGATLDDLLGQVTTLNQRLDSLLVNQRTSAAQVVVTSGGLADISNNLGTVIAGEFRAGNGEIPGAGFSGVRLAYPAMSYGGSLWNVAGVLADVLQFGLRSSDGAALAGAGAVVLSAAGISATLGAIGGWTLGATTISSTGVTMTSGAGASLAFGATPPTSPTVGTGIFINSTGLFGLSANVQQAYINSSGQLLAGAGDVQLGVSGIKIGGVNQRLSFYLTNAMSTLIGYLAGTAPSWSGPILQGVNGGVGMAAQDAPASLTASLQLVCATGLASYAALDGTGFNGLNIGGYSDLPSGIPTKMLEVNGAAIFASTVTAAAGLNVGSASGAGTGAIKASAAISGVDGTFTGGLNVGSATGAGTGQIKATTLQMSNTGSFNVFLRIDQDNNQNNQGLYVNALWNGDAPATYNYVGTTAFGGAASRLVMTGASLTYEQATGGVNPLTWVTKFSIASGGGITTNGSNQANGAVATAMSSLGPAGSHTTIQEWLKITVGGNVRYIPMF